jgi:hypothetical protein
MLRVYHKFGSVVCPAFNFSYDFLYSNILTATSTQILADYCLIDIVTLSLVILGFNILFLLLWTHPSVFILGIDYRNINCFHDPSTLYELRRAFKKYIFAP